MFQVTGGIVRIQLTAEEPRKKLRFRHEDLRDAQQTSGRSIQELLNDKFGGWPYLLMFAQRAFEPKMSLDVASRQIDAWVNNPDPETKKDRTLDDLGLVLLELLYAARFIERPKQDANDDEAAEGNAPPESGD